MPVEPKSYHEIMDRLPDAVGRGGWMAVEAYLEYEIAKLMGMLVDENDSGKVKQLQGEVRGLRKLLRLREDVLTYTASDDSSAPDA